MSITNYTGILACLSLAACSGLSNQSDNNDSLIEHVSETERAEINAARAEYDQASDAHAGTRQEVVRAKAACALAQADLELAEARVEHAEAVEAAAKTGTEDELRDATEELRVARADVQPQRDLIHWRECELSRCEKAAVLAECEQELAEARVGLVKARAFAQVDQAASRNIDVPAQEALVIDRQERASIAAVELEASRRSCDLAQRTFDEATVASKEEQALARATHD